MPKAGTGKSTLVSHIVSALELNPEEDVAYCAFTGKAAQVLIDKGNSNATTLHKLLYIARPTQEGKYIFKKRNNIDYKVVICDECSMVPIEIVNDLLQHDVFVVFCGDPGQLPPVSRDSDNHLLDNPDVFLDQVMRQAADSGIIQLSMKIRNNETITGFKSHDAMVLPKREFDQSMLLWADQVLCATNKTRIELNTKCRELLGYRKPIEEGESLICLKNDWDTCSSSGAALTNGVIGKLTNFTESLQRYPRGIKIPDIPIIIGHFISDTGEDFGILKIDKNCILTGQPTLSPQQKFILARNRKFKDTIPYEFTYSYAMTTWKAQGSEFGKVLCIEERHPFDIEEHQKFLYTSVTRGSNRVVLITKE